MYICHMWAAILAIKMLNKTKMLVDFNFTPKKKKFYNYKKNKPKMTNTAFIFFYTDLKHLHWMAF